MTTESIAIALEDAKLELAGAEKAHTDAAQRVQTLQGRIEAIQARQTEITQRRLNGEVLEAETNELAASNHDLDALTVMVEKARSEEAGALHDLESARAKLATVESEWARHQSEQTIAALVSRAKELEGRLVQCLGEIAHQAIAAGHGIMPQVWEPTVELREFATRTDLNALASLRRVP